MTPSVACGSIVHFSAAIRELLAPEVVATGGERMPRDATEFRQELDEQLIALTEEHFGDQLHGPDSSLAELMRANLTTAAYYGAHDAHKSAERGDLGKALCEVIISKACIEHQQLYLRADYRRPSDERRFLPADMQLRKDEALKSLASARSALISRDLPSALDSLSTTEFLVFMSFPGNAMSTLQQPACNTVWLRGPTTWGPVLPGVNGLLMLSPATLGMFAKREGEER